MTRPLPKSNMAHGGSCALCKPLRQAVMINLKRSRTMRALALTTTAWAACCVVACGSGSKEIPSSSSGSSQRSTTSALVNKTLTNRPPQNDDYISTYGSEASGVTRKQIITVVNRYYSAIERDDGRAACALIHTPLAKSVAEDYGQPPGPAAWRGRTCAIVMSKFFKHPPLGPAPVLPRARITGVRINPNHDIAFVQMSSKSTPTGEIPVQREGAVWKMRLLIGEACARCAAR
jgi:hypothetical protein